MPYGRHDDVSEPQRKLIASAGYVLKTSILVLYQRQLHWCLVRNRSNLAQVEGAISGKVWLSFISATCTLYIVLLRVSEAASAIARTSATPFLTSQLPPMQAT